MKNIRLTPKQEELMKWVNGEYKQYGNEDYFYCETGDCKPFDDRTVKSLIRRKLVECIDNSVEGVYFLRTGSVYKATIRKNKINEILKNI